MWGKAHKWSQMAGSQFVTVAEIEDYQQFGTGKVTSTRTVIENAVFVIGLLTIR